MEVATLAELKLAIEKNIDITSIHLCVDNIGKNVDSISNLIYILENSKNLVSLTLNKENIQSYFYPDDHIGSKLAEAISKNKSLEYINLNGKFLGEEEYEYIADAIKNNNASYALFRYLY